MLFEPIAFPPTEDVDAAKNSPLAVGALRRRRRFDSYEHAYDNYASKPPLNQFDPEVLRNYVDYGFAPVEPAGDDSNDDGMRWSAVVAAVVSSCDAHRRWNPPRSQHR